MVTKLVCIVGMTGSGKSLVADELVKEGYSFLRFGQITLDRVKEKGLEPTEENERKIREQLRTEQGMDAFAKLNIPKFDQLLQEGNVVGDGLYSWSEYKTLKNYYGSRLIVIAVLAPPEVRYARLSQRKDIDEKMRNRPASKEQAQARDYAEIECIEKGGPIAMADYNLFNISTKEQLLTAVKKVVEELKMNRPTWDEYFLRIANEVSKRATCLRGRIGVVLVKNKRIIATGYNGSPKGLPHCTEVGCKIWKTIDETGKEEERCLRTVHGEANAIAQAALQGTSTEGATLYGTYKPCSTCMKLIINAGIKKVVCEKNYHDIITDELAKNTGTELVILEPDHDSLDTVKEIDKSQQKYVLKE